MRQHGPDAGGRGVYLDYKRVLRIRVMKDGGRAERFFKMLKENNKLYKTRLLTEGLYRSKKKKSKLSISVLFSSTNITIRFLNQNTFT